jgi:hypothetical protein
LLTTLLLDKAKIGADVATAQLYQRLDYRYEERTGATYYDELDRFSSTPSQYPQEVTGQLQASVGTTDTPKRSGGFIGYLSGVGVAGDVGMSQEELEELNYGSSDGRQKGRFFMEETYKNDPSVHNEMLRNMEKL